MPWWLLYPGLFAAGYLVARIHRDTTVPQAEQARQAVAKKRAQAGALVSPEERAQIQRSSDPQAAIQALVERKEAEARTILQVGPIRITE